MRAVSDIASGYRRASRSAAASSSSAVSPARLAQQPVGLAGVEAELEQPVAGDRARVVGAAHDDRPVVGLGDARLLAQLDDDPLGRALADPRHGLEARRVAGRERRQQLARRAAAEHCLGDLRADALDADQQQEQVALLLGREAVELERVVADDQVAVEADRRPDGRHVAQRLGADREAVADARRRLDDDVVGAADRDVAGDQRDHRAPPPPRARRSGRGWRGRSPPRARRRRGRASAAVARPSSAWTIRVTWSLSARP